MWPCQPMGSDWRARIDADRVRAERLQTPEQRALTAELLARAQATGASAVALTGSTARGRRTAISDLDYHVVGPRPDTAGLPADVDVVAETEARLRERLEEGDDFPQWTLRFGCILVDREGSMQRAAELIERAALWPDPQAKLDHALPIAELAEKVLCVGDREAALGHVRSALTTTARGILLARRTFPLARDELAGQLEEAGDPNLGHALAETIHEQPEPDRLREMIDLVRSRAAERAAMLAR